ncbi:nuclear pore complex protein NUP98A-like isoform X2 [Nicotiana sylvestris]|uniref:nuclear pore complex protein NUP98A-like isoform X2 n=1 Tax=Nicotiana sylvestris TaxID=4096 RepID=UPI00388C58FD
MERLWLKLKMMKQQMKMLNATNFSKVDVRVQIARQQLTELHEHMRDSSPAHELYIKEKELKENLEKWILVEESILRQKSRVHWLKLGDTNSTYFHANIKNRITQNQIRSLVSDRGEMIQSEKGIEDEILGFYKQLLGANATQMPAIHPSIMAEGPILNREQQIQLIEPVTKEEICQALKSISDLKAPGCDEFNACFFKKAWPIIGDEVSDAIQQFFSSTKMFKAINCTTVTLIPKLQVRHLVVAICLKIEHLEQPHQQYLLNLLEVQCLLAVKTRTTASSATNSATAFQTQDKSLGSSSTLPTFGKKYEGNGVSNESLLWSRDASVSAPAFGVTSNSHFGMSSTPTFGSCSFDKPAVSTSGISGFGGLLVPRPFNESTVEHFGTSSTPRFGSYSFGQPAVSMSASNPLFSSSNMFGSTPEIGQTRPLFGDRAFGETSSASSVFAQPIGSAVSFNGTTTFNAANNATAFQTQDRSLGSSTLSTFGKKYEGNGVANKPLLWSRDASVSAPAFGVASNSHFGMSSTSAFGSYSFVQPAVSTSGISGFGGLVIPRPFDQPAAFVSGKESTAPLLKSFSFGKAAFGFNQKGSRIASYIATPEKDSTRPGETIQSICGMHTYKDKSQEELRFEDYQLGTSGFGVIDNSRTFQSPVFNQSTFDHPNPFAVEREPSCGRCPNPFAVKREPSYCHPPNPFVVKREPFDFHPPNPFGVKREPSYCHCPNPFVVEREPFDFHPPNPFAVKREPSYCHCSNPFAMERETFDFHPPNPFAVKREPSYCHCPNQFAMKREPSYCHCPNPFVMKRAEFDSLSKEKSITTPTGTGTRVASYAATREVEGQYLNFLSISAMPMYSNKSHEELRLDDYESANKGAASISQSKPLESSSGSTASNVSFSPWIHLSPFAAPLKPDSSSPITSALSSAPILTTGAAPQSTLCSNCLNKFQSSCQLQPTSPRLCDVSIGLENLTTSSQLSTGYPLGPSQKPLFVGPLHPGMTPNVGETLPTAISSHPATVSVESAAEEAMDSKHDDKDVDAIMPKLQRSDYYTVPPIQELISKEKEEPGFCSHVTDFVVGRHGYGSIKFLGETDVRKLDLDSAVHFNCREVIIYMDESKKPPVGQGLNKSAEITLLNVRCINKSNGKEYTDGPMINKYRDMLIKKAGVHGAEFVSYDPVKGEWAFEVSHF